MAKIVFDLIVFATGMSFGVVLASYLFHAKHREIVEAVNGQIDLSLDTIGIKRTEYETLAGQVCLIQRTITEHGRLLNRDEMTTARPG